MDRRAAIFAVSPDTAGIRGRVLRMARRRIGLAPGIMRVLLTDLRVGLLANLLYLRVNGGGGSPGAPPRAGGAARAARRAPGAPPAPRPPPPRPPPPPPPP